MDLAAEVGRTASAIAHIERGALTPSDALLEEIARVLHVQVGDLLAEAAS